jgi:hypothetical protein
MTTYFEDIVNVTLLENAEYIDDNNYRLILNNEEINQQGTLVLVDMYPSHSFVTGFLLTTINHTNIDSTTPTHFFIEFKDDVTTFKFDFQNNSVNCALTITMENYQTDKFEIYPIYSGTHPSFYDATDMTFEIKLLNGFLWLYVNNTTWIEKFDMDEHPLSLESGSIQYTATCTTEIISHEIKNIYFEPIMVFSDDVYFEKSIYAEKIEGLEDNLVLCEEDVKISIPTSSIVSYIGNTYIDDPTFKNILGKTVNRDDYIELANQIGIPKSQTTFRVTNPSGWNFQGDYIQVGSTITPSLYERGGNLHKTIPIVSATDDLNNPYGISLWMYTQNTQKAGLAWTIGGKTSFGIQSILSPEGDRTALIENLYPNTNETWERMTIKHLTGNIGIGTTNPTAKLEVAGDIKATRYFGIDYNDLNNKPWILNNTSLSYTGGNVGIGTTNPTKKLQVIGDVSIAGNLSTTLSISYNTIALNFIPLTPLPYAGNIEYDGTVMYSSVGFGYRGAITSKVYYAAPQSSVSFQNNTSIQTIFAKNIILVSDKSYIFKMFLNKRREATSGTFTTHTIKLGFAGTAIISKMNYTALSTRNAVPNANNPIQGHIQVDDASIVVVTAGFNNLTETTIIEIEGFIRCSVGGTFIPQLQYSTAPMTSVVGYTDVVNEGSYISFEPIGSATATEFGNTWV